LRAAAVGNNVINYKINRLRDFRFGQFLPFIITIIINVMLNLRYFKGALLMVDLTPLQ